jgi:hypothetical protein
MIAGELKKRNKLLIPDKKRSNREYKIIDMQAGD